MKIAFLADNQVDERSRLEEHDRVMDFIAEDLRERKVDLVLHGGDVYERRSTVVERASVARFLGKVALTTHTFIVAGNHEAAGEVQELNLLPRVIASERPTMVPFRGAAGPLVAMLPWPRRAALASWVAKPLGREELNTVGLDALRSILRGFAQGWKDWKGPKILLAHAMVRGSRQGPDQPIMPGQDFELGLEDLALADAHVNLLGHVHMPQAWATEGSDGLAVPTIYAGSPRRTAYASGELEPKGYVVLEFDGNRLTHWEQVPTPATPMVLIEAEWKDRIFSIPEDGMPDSAHFKGAEVRFRYAVDADEREQAKAGAVLLANGMIAHGAAEVMTEEIVRPRSVARLAAVSGDIPLAAKLKLLWDRDGLDEARRPSLLRRVAELESVHEGK